MNWRMCGTVVVLALTVSASGVFAGGGLPALTTVRVANGLDDPLFVTHVPGDFDRAFVVEQPGRIRILDLTTDTLIGTPFLDITGIVRDSGNEEGLLGLAFHPDHQSNGLFYVFYVDSPFPASNGNLVVAEYGLTGNPNVADAGSANILLTIPHPSFGNHNGGWIGFGPNDGYLYIATGDGGSGCGPNERSQDITNELLGKILRIDVGTGGGYTNPPDNPFVGVTGDDEIWAYGLRNPWRCAFDRETGDFYIADVGQFQIEEINFQPASSTGGENYGWDCREGNECASDNGCTGAAGCACGDGSLVDPLRVYNHSLGCSITGGEVYRGCAIRELQGTYFFADVCSNRIWRTTLPGGGLTSYTQIQNELDPPGFSISSITSFGTDAYGEIYIVDRGGEVFRIVPEFGPFNDCNTNTTEDACEILDGSEADVAPMNGVPDTCEAGIPTVSQWGTVMLTLLLAVAGTLVFRSRGYVPA